MQTTLFGVRKERHDFHTKGPLGDYTSYPQACRTNAACTCQMRGRAGD